MEDEDGESKVMDMWNILGDQQLKDPTFGNTLKHSVDNVYIDTIEEEKRISRYNSVTAKDSPSRNTSTGSKIVFKGFKKRILAQAQETQSVASKSISQEQLSHPNVSPKNNKEKRTETKRGKITEYAQYLGLQPSSKLKCSKCHSSTNYTSTNSKQSQCTCNTAMAPMQGLPSTSETSSQSHATNFKITRKVYLCAACGTYFENWNLFLHMRDIHKRHICLFCLGMFGQAERLSYHLSKKHSVPEMGFNSVEDFYSAFKGSCYLVCCTCEKMFSETDNFYNHFCSPPTKQEAAATVCTLCRQTGSHASTCALAVESNKETNSVVPVTTTVQAGTVSTFVTEKPTNISNKGTSKKVIKNNRNKYGEDSISNSCQQPVKKVNAKAIISQCNENQLFSDTVVRDGIVQDEDTANVTRDTVSETIMEVSKYIDDSCSNEVEQKEDSISSIGRVSPENSQIQNNNQIEPYDSVTETIMEVSRCTNDTEVDEDIPKENENQSDTTDISSNAESQTENRYKMDSIPVEPVKETNEELQDSSSEQQPIKDTEIAKDEEAEESKVKLDSESHSSSSPAHSPVSRSLFSPQHESQQDLQPKEEYPDDGSKHVEPAPPTESQTSVSFNTVPASDRSLVIKICTNKNSQFSVSSTAVNVGNAETHNISKDSEENNNAEGSTSEEKLLSLSQKDKDNTESPINEADSDSDSDKLAVVDSNAEEVDDVKESNQLESTGEANTSTETKEDTSAHEDKGEFAIGETTNGELSATEQDNDETKDTINCAPELPSQPSDGIILAGEDVPPIDLNVEGTLDSTEIEDLLKKCIEAASPFCVYCNHARHIAVNGKQLGLHMLAEHKFHPQHPAIIIQPEQFTARVKKSLEELDSEYFNLETYSSTKGTYDIQTVRTYECFHCRYNSAVHKELYTHHRKMHQKTILICIMCKSTFYSYSELLCHLCPGIYSPNINVKYRCCLCSISSLPSAFRLMVHLRKSHHACDVCLETTGNQQRLSNHVWKHKLHHLCYRCGIAYRNKPDITKHLFWKHGTESVLCKKCLQKKWPHIYHFCIPPTAFVCEECGSSFSRAVALKVHKRLHSGDRPYSCTECSERFISQRLLTKHEERHKELPPVDVCTTDTPNNQLSVDDEKAEKDKTIAADIASNAIEGTKDVKETVKKVVDVYDLPPLNLSSDSDSETDEAKDSTKKNEETLEKSETVERNTEEAVSPTTTTTKVVSPVQATDNIADEEENEEEKKQEAKIMDGIWDNFKSYTASLEMQESTSSHSNKEPEIEIDVAYLRSIVLADHDYCVVWSEKDKTTEGGTKEDEKVTTDNVDYPGYANKLQRSPSAGSLAQNASCESDVNKKKVKSPKKKKQNGSTSSSDSSSESDSSSCSCGTNCSCSSSSSGSSSSSSSSSDSDSSASESSPRKSSNRKERKKEKETVQEHQSVSPENENKEAPIEVDNVHDAPVESISMAKVLLRESDLETDETETDEDFYDEHPQQLANKLLAEKRNQLLLLAAVAPASTESGIPLNNGITDESCVTPSPNPTPSVEEQPQQQKRKVKTKKRKRGERGKQRVANPMVESLKLNIPKAYYQKNSNFSVSSVAINQHQQHHHLGRSSTPNLITNEHQTSMTPIESHPSVNQNVGGSGSETENKRSSKRKRIPKRFYGDSSDEETEKQPTMKWRKVVETPPFVAAANPKPVPQRLSFGGKTVAYRPSVVESHTDSHLNVAAASATESEGPADSSSESSDSDVEMSIQQQSQVASHVPESNAPIPERAVNLYCYCQCPYDEVSEMIACDGEDCRIEWFHFECVGIMVPPKGKWYCPDCRKKHGIVQNSEDFFD